MEDQTHVLVMRSSTDIYASFKHLWAVVLALLLELSIPTAEIGGSYPVIGNLFTANCIEKTKIKKIVTVNGSLKNIRKNKFGKRSRHKNDPISCEKTYR